MKVFICIVFFFIINCSYAQISLLEKEITIDKHSGTIEELLKEISIKGDFYFTYSSSQIPIDKRFFFLSRKQTVKVFLDAMFKDYGVEYIERYNKIILKSLAASINTITLTGIVKDKSCNDGISGVNIKIEGTTYGEMTDMNGNFSIQVPVHKQFNKINLICSHIAYTEVTLSVKKDKIKNIEIMMDMNVMNIPEVRIFGVPQIAYANTEFQIYDYELFLDNILLVVYEKKLSRSNLLLVDKEMKVVCLKEVNGTPVGMYKDCIGSVNLITFYYPFNVTLNAGCLAVKFAKQDRLNKINKPCVAKAKNGLHYYYYYGPARLSVDYSFYNPITKTDSVFRNIQDTAASNLLKEKLEKSTVSISRGSMADIKVGEWDGDDKETFQQDADDNKKNLMYAPLLAIKDSLYIFNHCEGKIEVYNIYAKFKRSVPVNYYKIQGWKHKIYLDNETGRAYTCFWKNGIYEVNEINLNTGKLEESCKIHFAWIDKIQINAGHIYYLYKSAQNNFKKCLYKQKL